MHPKGRMVATLLALASGSGAWAQTYPQKPIRFVVGFPAGGGADLAGRSVAQKIAESFGVKSCRIAEPDALADAVRDGLQGTEPLLIDVPLAAGKASQFG